MYKFYGYIIELPDGNRSQIFLSRAKAEEMLPQAQGGRVRQVYVFEALKPIERGIDEGTTETKLTNNSDAQENGQASTPSAG